MLDSRNNNSKIVSWIATIAMGTLMACVCLSDTYNTQPIIGLCVGFLLLCILGLVIQRKIIQQLRPLILLGSFIWFGFITGGCNCLLYYFQGFILFLVGKSAFWLSFSVIITILILSVVFGSIWCGWLCWLGALQEFVFKQNKWKFWRKRKTQKILRIVQISAFVALVVWVIVAQRPVFCNYDPFFSIFRMKILNRVGYFTVPLLIVSSVYIYRPFCRLLCPIGLLLYVLKYLPFAAKLKIEGCSDCKKCHFHCKQNAIHNKNIDKTCILCGECKNENCSSIKLQ